MKYILSFINGPDYEIYPDREYESYVALELHVKANFQSFTSFGLTVLHGETHENEETAKEQVPELPEGDGRSDRPRTRREDAQAR
jgi:hypothetical protein